MLKKIILLFVIIVFFNTNSFSLENNIIAKIENQIVTSLDVKKEYRYLIGLNPSLKNSKKEDVIKLSKKSVIQENIKKIEIKKNFNNPEIPQEFFDQIFQNVYSRIGLASLDDFKKYLIENNIEFEDVKKKLEIEALWNELILLKFS